MGGEREAYVEPKQKVKKNPPDPPSVVSGGRVRIHESSGEAHFHDDQAGLKVAVPVGAWYQAWVKLRSEPQTKFFADQTNKAMLVIETQYNEGVLDAVITLMPLTIGPNYTTLDKFTMK